MNETGFLSKLSRSPSTQHKRVLSCTRKHICCINIVTALPPFFRVGGYPAESVHPRRKYI